MSAPREARSVGELLLDTEFIAREVLFDAPDLDAAAMVRTWGEVVHSAGQLWVALPYGPAGDLAGEGLMMDRLQEMTTALHRAIRARPWPGGGPPDPRLAAMAGNLDRAGELVRAAHPGRPTRAQTRDDLAAARTRLMHGLYLGAHGVALAVRSRVRELQAEHDPKRRPAKGRSLSDTRAVENRLAAFEQLAGSYVARTYPGALRGEHRLAPQRDRLAHALAGWDVQAHRALAHDPSSANLMLVARTQAMAVGYAQLLLAAAAQCGHLPRQEYATALAPAVEAVLQAWTSTARTWGELTPPSQRHCTPQLAVAAGEVRAAWREVTYQWTGPAPAPVIQARTDVPAAVDTVQQFLATGLELAHLMRHVLHERPAPVAARGVNEILKAPTTGPTHAAHLDPDAAFVDPRDLATNRAIGQPALIRDLCGVDLDATIEAARGAMNSGAVLDRRPLRPRKGAPEAPPRSLSSGHTVGMPGHQPAGAHPGRGR